jgi:hypothetical protein
MAEEVRKEEFKVDGTELLKKVREIIKEGNARRIIIKHEGKTLLEVPLTIGVAGAAALTIFTPVLVAIGAIAGIITHCTLIVEKVEKMEENHRSCWSYSTYNFSPGIGCNRGNCWTCNSMHPHR